MAGWAEQCEQEIAGAKSLGELERLGRRLSSLVRDLEGARATVAAGEIRAVGLDEFLRRYGAGAPKAAAGKAATKANGAAAATAAPAQKRRRRRKPGPKKGTPKPAAAKAGGRQSKGDATTAEVKAVLDKVGKKGMSGAQLRAAVGGKRFKDGLAALKYETFGTGVGLGRQIRLI
jgi:hypothetical protein